MEGKRYVILFVLLQTFYSALGTPKFTFSRKAHEVIVGDQGDNLLPLMDNQRIKFGKTEVSQNWIVTQHEGKVFFNLSPVEPQCQSYGRTEKPEIYSLIQRQFLERLSHMSISFEPILDEPTEITVAFLEICFKDDKLNGHKTCFVSGMFSRPETQEDISFAEKVAEKITPFSTQELESIAKGEPFKWALSTLQTILSRDKIKLHDYLLQSLYTLQPIIVDENILMKFYQLANS